MKKRVLILFNPSAGARSGRAKVHELARLLAAEGFLVEILAEFGALGDRAASYLAAKELRAVVAAGGDGTVAGVANQTPIGTPIGILPLGTENLVSRYAGSKPNPASLVRTICRGTFVRLDVGRAGNRLFLLMVGCGLDAEVVRRVHERRRGHIRHVAYFKPILDSIRSYNYPEIRVSCDAFEAPPAGSASPCQVAARPFAEIRAKWVFVANLPLYAAGLRIVPGAAGNDGMLDVCTFRQGSFWHGLRYLGTVLLGQHHACRDCRTLRAVRVRLESNEPVPFQTDGDPGGCLPVDIDILPERLKLLVPAPIQEAFVHADSTLGSEGE